MRSNFWIASAIALAMALTVSGCASSPGHESTGEYVDSSTITAKVKAAILAEPGLKSMQIGVETYKDQVQLSGFVDSAEARQHAGDVAMTVNGVRSVKNDLQVK